MENVDIAIVGGGPAGMAAANAATSGGADTLVLEKGVPRADRQQLGPDSTDAAGILDYWVEIMDIHPDEFPDDVLLQHLDQAEFIGPNESCTLTSTGVESDYEHFGYTFHRTRFDDWLRKRAEDAGAEYRVDVRVQSVNSDHSSKDGPRHTIYTGNGNEIGAEFIILADGPQRTITNRVLNRYLPEGNKASKKLAAPEANHIAYQEYRRFPQKVFEELKTSIKFWWGHIPGHTAYPWVFPNNKNVCRVGLTMPIGLDIDDIENREAYPLLEPDDEVIPNGSTYIHRLLELVWGNEYDIKSDFPLVKDRGKSDGTETYSISSTPPIDSPVNAGIAVTGGAMGTTSAFHEGGDHVAIRTGTIAGKLAAAGDLSEYNDRWHNAIGNEVLRNVTFAELCQDYNPQDWDQTFNSVRKMLKNEGRQLLSASKIKAGLSGAKIYYKYKKTKKKIKQEGYTKLDESDYIKCD